MRRAKETKDEGVGRAPREGDRRERAGESGGRRGKRATDVGELEQFGVWIFVRIADFFRFGVVPSCKKALIPI